jgi:hypothetical protein
MAKQCEMNEQKELLRNGYGGQAKVSKVTKVTKVEKSRKHESTKVRKHEKG